jgi:outer membrane protein assembly factor BamB
MRKGTAALPVFLLLCWFIAPDRESSAANWPRFRGPNGTGTAVDKDIPLKWSEKNVLWKAELPGSGNSSPVIWGKRLFLQSATADERFLLCLDVADGSILWKKQFPAAIAGKHEKNTFASSTPTTDGERVYALIWDGKKMVLYAYDLKGKYLWHRDLGGPFKGRHGVGASPVVFAGKVFLNNDQTASAKLIALDAKTGKPTWQKKRTAFRACYSTPFVLERAGGKAELIVSSTAGITSYNPKDGDENWNWNWKFSGMALRTVGSPVAGAGMIFAGSGDGSGARHMVAVKADGKGDVSKTNLVWEKKRDTPYVPCMLIKGDYLYWINDKGIAACLRARDGKKIWNERLFDCDVTASPLLIDGKIYAVSEDGDVAVLAADPKFKVLARNALDEPVMATPAEADHRLFIRGNKHLFCIGKTSTK